MSGKGEKTDSPRGSKVLQKARSFKDDLKARIRRTPSASRSESERPVVTSTKQTNHISSLKSPTIKTRRKGLSRGGSFHEPRRDKTEELSDAERLDIESKKVQMAMMYLCDVVDKGILEQLSGSTTIVLETVMETLQLLGNYFVNQDSGLLLSLSSQLYLSLANLVRWADQILLSGQQTLQPESAKVVIDAVQNGFQELVNLCKEKLKERNLHNSYPNKQTSKGGRRNSSTQDSSGRKSLPDIPLTPQEQQILSSIRNGSGQDRTAPGDGNEDASPTSPPPTATSPPPKPPLPAKFSLEAPLSDDVTAPGGARRCSQPAQPTSDLRPPLPSKTRSYSGCYDNDSGAVSPRTQCSDNCVTQHRERPANTISNDGQGQGQGRALSLPGSPCAGALVAGDAGTATAGSHVGEVRGQTSASFHLSVTQQHHSSTAAPPSTSPRSQSPNSSAGSSFNDDVVDGRAAAAASRLGPEGGATGGPSHRKTEARLSHYDNYTGQTVSGPHPGGPHPGGPPEEGTQLSDLTRQITALTTSIDVEVPASDPGGRHGDGQCEEVFYDNVTAVDGAGAGAGAGAVATANCPA